MTTGARTAIAQSDPARSPAAVAHLPTQHRQSGHASRGSRALTPTGADPARGDPVVIDLATRARHGEQQAWNALVERYSPLIWSICRRHRLSDADAEDSGRSVWLLLAQQLVASGRAGALNCGHGHRAIFEFIASRRSARWSPPTSRHRTGTHQSVPRCCRSVKHRGGRLRSGRGDRLLGQPTVTSSAEGLMDVGAHLAYRATSAPLAGMHASSD
jgi:hypothetical protein